jgi:transcription-repair coupling factor (superfamily II helicase)
MLDRLLSPAERALLLRQVRDAYPGGVLTSLHGSSASLAAALLFEDAPAPTLVITATLDEADAVTADLTTLLPQHAVLHFPEQETLPYDKKSPYKGIVGQQVEVLHRLLAGETCIVVTSAKGLVWKVLPPREIRDYTLRFAVGDELDLETTLQRFGEMGYYDVARVETPGDFARKGGILDVFGVSYENPVRLELVGDTIESIRFFDATTQRSLREIPDAVVPPCSPLILSRDNVQRAVAAVGALRHGSDTERRKLQEHIEERLHFDGMERFAPFYSTRALLTDYLGGDARLLWMRPQLIVEAVRRLDHEIRRSFADCVQAGEPVPAPEQVYASPEDLITLSELMPTLYLSDVNWSGQAPPLEAWREPAPVEPEHMVPDPERRKAPPENLPPELLEDFGEWDGESATASPETAAEAPPPRAVAPRRTDIPDSLPPRVVRCEVHATTPYAGNIPELRRDLAKRIRLGQRIHIFCDNEGQAERLREILDEIADDLDFPVGELQSGFVLPGLGTGVVVLTDREIFHRYRKRQRRRKYRVSQGTSAYEELQPGDFVVHVTYGIARYLGIKSLRIEASEMDCLELLFADGDKIFVTVDQINMVEKYVGKEGVAPALTKLGGTSWARAKAKAQAAIEDMAKELLELAAVRASRKGHAFAGDQHLLKELEASFIYDETPDQLTAIADVKRDMERPQPMDRLICGDVGYGKTEVAIRAAFKAVLDNRQVAVLVPTTILAQQHLNTFQERFADFPVQVEMLSRLRSPKESKAVLERLARGEIDVVIGTHRILSKDVQFKSLGLIVIDEEHRFGVGHKEKLKHLKQTVDALSMTATPIPRTLNMALIGLRDMSQINTAPRDRLPVQTEILPFDEETIVDSVLRELDRGGQVYFVHNRVESIDAMAGYLRRVVPSARIAIGHGQMDEHVLERVMLDFMERKYDILVSTMIIESGLDIPNVNTLLVNRADRLGLAQLYQLRGRVGRSNHKAYAYFMVPRGGTTTELARKRLAVLQEFEALGSGFKIAMRDLEIRGAGNILGQQQHGHLVAIGFELYCKLLEQTVAEMQGLEVPEEIATKVEIDSDYLIPDGYVPDPEEKMRVYKRIAAMLDVAEVEPLRAELADRYGPLPEPTATLLQVAALRLRAWRVGIERLKVRPAKAELLLRQGVKLGRAEIETLVRTSPNKLGFDATDGFKIIVHFKGTGRVAERLTQVEALLASLDAAAPPLTAHATKS